LTPAERKALVAAGRDKLGSLREAMSEHHEHLQALADELELSDAQRRAIKDRARAAMKARFEGHVRDHREHEARFSQIADAFASDAFDAAKLDVGKDGRAMTRRFADAMISLVDAAMPELTPAQRQKLADHIEQHTAAK
ncbi:MAG TPA: hypothetical protein VHB21_16475, partial [Minicystis sp.]|nr:hypothetical protein [Minicystis sp.]